MSVGVGLRVGTTVSSVAVTSPTPGRPDPDPIERVTAVHLHSDGTATLGDHDVVDGTTSSFTDFVDRVGHSGGVRANDGSLSRAEDLVATAIECLLADAAGLLGDARYTAVATYPTDWPASTVSVLRNALDYVGLRHVSLVSDAEAAAAWFESQVSHRTGRLVAVYHIDPQGSTVTLVRSGIVAGHAFRFAEDDAPSVEAQLSTALETLGWSVSNLDAMVVTADEAVDPRAAQLVAQSVKTGLGLRCALAPEPHQTMVRGAALAAAAGSVDLLGSTQVLPTAKLPEPTRTALDPEATEVLEKITVPPTDAPEAAPAAPTALAAPGDEEKPRRKSSMVVAITAAAAIALLVGVGALVFSLREVPTAAAGTQASETAATTTSSTARPSSSAPRSSTTTTTTTTAVEDETVDASTTARAPQTTQQSPATADTTTYEEPVVPAQEPAAAPSSTGSDTYTSDRTRTPYRESRGDDDGDETSTGPGTDPEPEPEPEPEPAPEP
ncbi:hypothetical protein OED52_17525 [Rhodococcus sp. Z13]|uniref:Uncharacterized protein n=1 Tax=Rhodococcus sacchari TaxID=2962047 RepID=A0ACD4DEC7_9NOCA|nr:hypothetical protein [Rhodococcus sp. Z13]UYP18437.1 hypothetical protein OED52_17525 [Rhodococcus sp. Z13]